MDYVDMILGMTHPLLTNLTEETLDFRGIRFSPMFSLFKPIHTHNFFHYVRNLYYGCHIRHSKRITNVNPLVLV